MYKKMYANFLQNLNEIYNFQIILNLKQIEMQILASNYNFTARKNQIYQSSIFFLIIGIEKLTSEKCDEICRKSSTI